MNKKHFIFDVFGILIDGETHEPFKDTLEILKELKKENHKVYVLSNVTPYGYDILKSLIDVSIFDDMFLSCEMDLYKPSFEMFQKVIELIGDNPKNIYYFDDKPRNVENSKQLGINSYLTHGSDIKRVYEEIKKEI